MSDTTLIMLCAGGSTRFGMDVKKHWLRIEEDPLWYFVTKRLTQQSDFFETIVVGSADEISFMSAYEEYKFVAGGNTRQQSLKNALEYVTTPYVLVSDVARACIPTSLLDRILQKKGLAASIVPCIDVSDTVVYEMQTINREALKRVQTPQLSQCDILKKALQTEALFTDESSAIVAFGGERIFVEGDVEAHKLTFAHDLLKTPCLRAPSSDTLGGNGFDVHPFEDGKAMWLGGVKIESSFGFKAHSDGDVAIHALIDALLGAAGMGDIGTLFPDSDASYKNIDSKELLGHVVTKLHHFGYSIINVDLTIIAQTPRLESYKGLMRERLSEILHIAKQRVNIKATTTEKLGFLGRSEGVGVLANANLKYFNWKMIGQE